MDEPNEYNDWLNELERHNQWMPHISEESQNAISGLLNLSGSVNVRASASTNPRQTPISPMKREGQVTSPLRPVVLAAPIPISYAVRNRSALRHMLSLGEEDREDGGSNIAPSCPSPEIATDNQQQTPANADPLKTESKKMEFRPISPGTLIALADPSILSICAEMDPPPIQYPLPAIFQHNGPVPALPVPFPTAPPGLDMMLDLVKGSEDWMIPTETQNMWGY
ncbi:hypothetical protein CVT24_006957 [Panaeolus cyanescens]|uniref:Uncharacterized protein n=1 Tax=Panaeolus cyanescens TaxID=181874 RepID=A0A409VZY6_9AGAR|nr:hypothetical protein CVT24_006957 [Panaeolus cyanescens]